jgi:hypothetical protein
MSYLGDKRRVFECSKENTILLQSKRCKSTQTPKEKDATDFYLPFIHAKKYVINNIIKGPHTAASFHSIVFSTSDFESGNLGLKSFGTYFF